MASLICRPCIGLNCDDPDDLAAGIDSAFYSALDYSFIETCPPNCFCPPGLFPMTIVILASTIPPVIPPIVQPGDTIFLQLQGCTSLITRTLVAGSTQAQIAAAAQSMQGEWAGQQAKCNALATPGVSCSNGLIDVCNDALVVHCYDDNTYTIPAGTRCSKLDITGLTPDQIAANTALLKSKLNQTVKDGVCPFCGTICPLTFQILGGGNGFGVAVTNDSGTKSFDCTPITTHHIYNGNIVLDQSGVGSIAPLAVSSPVGGVGGFHGPGSNLLEIRYFGHLIFSFTNNWIGNLQVLMEVNCGTFTGLC